MEVGSKVDCQIVSDQMKINELKDMIFIKEDVAFFEYLMKDLSTEENTPSNIVNNIKLYKQLDSEHQLILKSRLIQIDKTLDYTISPTFLSTLVVGYLAGFILLVEKIEEFNLLWFFIINVSVYVVIICILGIFVNKEKNRKSKVNYLLSLLS